MKASVDLSLVSKGGDGTNAPNHEEIANRGEMQDFIPSAERKP